MYTFKFLMQNGTDRTNLCRLAHFQSGKPQKPCRVPTFIGIGTVLIIATLIIPILWSEVNKNGGSSNCTKGKNVLNTNRSIELNTEVV